MTSLTTDRPLKDAVDQISKRKPLGSVMSSREWEMVPAEIRLRAMFSARVESERLLAEMGERLQARIELARKDGRHIDRGVFIEEMRAELKAGGYKRGDAPKGSLRDLKSTRRLGLIFDMNVAQAQGYARWKRDMTEEGLDNEPCYELVRIAARVEHRPWPTVWEDHGGEFYGKPGPDYPNARGRMLARKTDPIWRRISRFKTPWSPLDWGSGMGLVGRDREECESLGVIEPDEVLMPLHVPFNSEVSASLEGIPESGREHLRSTFGDAIRIDGDTISIQRDTSPESHEQRKQDIGESLRQRARGHYLQASEELDRLRRNDDGAEVGFQGEGQSEIASIYLAQASAVAVGRKRLFHDTMTQAEAETFFRATAGFPSEVGMHYDPVAGHLLAWRKDLLDADPETLVAEMEAGGGGMLLGYGLDSPAFGAPHVLVRIFRLPRTAGDLPAVGFHAPLDSWRTFAQARARDLEDAWDVATETEWEVFP